jgi:hypothetical protein
MKWGIRHRDDNKVVVVALLEDGVDRRRANTVNCVEVVAVLFRRSTGLEHKVGHIEVMDRHVNENAT